MFRLKKPGSSDIYIWAGIALFAFICIMVLSGCDYMPREITNNTHVYKRKQQRVNEITCHWSNTQVTKGVCWCVCMAI